LQQMLADPDTRSRVKQVRAEMDQAEREQQMSLAMIRKAADLTQVELAARMGIKQSAVSGMESRPDILLSTLSSYLRAADARAVVTLGGRDVEYPLP
jgi:DNA-binding transcriptional regulator YiaG